MFPLVNPFSIFIISTLVSHRRIYLGWHQCLVCTYTNSLSITALATISHSTNVHSAHMFAGQSRFTQAFFTEPIFTQYRINSSSWYSLSPHTWQERGHDCAIDFHCWWFPGQVLILPVMEVSSYLNAIVHLHWITNNESQFCKKKYSNLSVNILWKNWQLEALLLSQPLKKETMISCVHDGEANPKLGHSGLTIISFWLTQHHQV